MPTPPPKRIYLDTNILWNWPNCSNQIWNLFEFAKWLKAEIYFPVIVEKELERHFLQATDEMTDRIDADLKALRKQCRYIIDIDTPGHAPSYDQFQAAYRERSEYLKAHFGIQTVPLTSITLDVFVDMAVNREPPFEEMTNKSKTGVVGLQDAAILFSVIEHIAKTKEPGRCVFVSDDAIFTRNEIKQLLDKSGVQLDRVRKAEALWPGTIQSCLARSAGPMGSRDGANSGQCQSEQGRTRQANRAIHRHTQSSSPSVDARSDKKGIQGEGIRSRHCRTHIYAAPASPRPI